VKRATTWDAQTRLNKHELAKNMKSGRVCSFLISCGIRLRDKTFTFVVKKWGGNLHMRAIREVTSGDLLTGK
jgi:hypothetical protein